MARPEAKHLIYFLSEKNYIRKFCSVKARGFWFKNWYFPLSVVVASYQCRIPCRIYSGLVASMLHLKRSSISSALPTRKVSMDLVVNLKTVKQPIILETFFQVRVGTVTGL